jgi:hypothetical protein
MKQESALFYDSNKTSQGDEQYIVEVIGKLLLAFLFNKQ